MTIEDIPTVPSNRKAIHEPRKLFRVPLGQNGNEFVVEEEVMLKNIQANRKNENEVDPNAPTEPQ
jgi:hypothetical protein